MKGNVLGPLIGQKAFKILKVFMQKIDVSLSPLPAYAKRTQDFYLLYDLVGGNLGLDSNKSSLAKKKDRVCRFCGQHQPTVKFTKDAHLVSVLVGNRNLFSDFECDDCNATFGQLFENDLANYLGISRSLAGTKARNGIPTFKCADNILTIRAPTIQNRLVSIASRAATSPGFFRKGPEKNITRFSYRKHPYTPIRVYKAFYKWAISILSAAQAGSYELGLKFLSGTIQATSECLLSGYILPFNYCFPPHYFLFEKRDKSSKVHTHVAVFYFQNYVLSCPIIFHEADRFFDNNETNITLYPPLFTQFTDISQLRVNPFYGDFFSDQEITDDREEVIWQMNAADLENSAVYNGNTGLITQAPYSPSDIKSFIMMRDENSEIDDPHTFFEEVKKYFS